MRISMFLFILGLTVTTVHASDGVFEINADCAIVGGCFDGDSGGYPVTITEPGSYRLTGNLSTSSEIVTFIDVTADNVTIDLNGYSLIGPVTCSGSTLTCNNSGVGDGIDAEGQGNIYVHNGSITGMGRDGLVVGRSARIERLTVAENARDGIVAQVPGSVLHRVSVRENGSDGIALGFGASYVMDSVVFNNGAQGVFGGFCGNVLMSGNTSNSCVAIAPNRCSTPSQCD